MRYLRVEILFLLLVALVATIIGWSGLFAAPVAGQDYRLVGKDLEPFRTAFDRASSEVRAVLLVGPT